MTLTNSRIVGRRFGGFFDGVLNFPEYDQALHAALNPGMNIGANNGRIPPQPLNIAFQAAADARQDVVPQARIRHVGAEPVERLANPVPLVLPRINDNARRHGLSRHDLRFPPLHATPAQAQQVPDPAQAAPNPPNPRAQPIEIPIHGVHVNRERAREGLRARLVERQRELNSQAQDFADRRRALQEVADAHRRRAAILTDVAHLPHRHSPVAIHSHAEEQIEHRLRNGNAPHPPSPQGQHHMDNMEIA